MWICQRRARTITIYSRKGSGFDLKKAIKKKRYNMRRTCLIFISCSKTAFFYLRLCSFPASWGLDVRKTKDIVYIRRSANNSGVCFLYRLQCIFWFCANFHLQNRHQQRTCFSNDIIQMQIDFPIWLEERVLINCNKFLVQSLQL